MLTVLTKDNWNDRRDLLEGMFRLRYRVLFEQLGWKELFSEDGLDRDASDHNETIYLVGTAPGFDGLVSCLRFAPSAFPTLSSTVFRSLFDAGLPEGPQIYDASRIVVDPATRRLGKPNPVTLEMMMGWLEAGVALGIDSFTGVIDLKKLQSGVASGWRVVPLGLPVQMGESEIVAIRMIPDQAVIDRLRGLLGVSEPVIDNAGRELLAAYHRRFIGSLAARKAA